MMSSLEIQEIEVHRSERVMPDETRRLLEDGRSRFDTVDCFDFVPCDYELLWSILDTLPRGRFCEWGSGMGLAVGMASQLGFEAVGFEIDEQLAVASRKLLADHHLPVVIEHADFTDYTVPADLFFVYTWPSRQSAAEEHFLNATPNHAQLLIAHGQSDFRLKVKVATSIG